MQGLTRPDACWCRAHAWTWLASEAGALVSYGAAFRDVAAVLAQAMPPSSGYWVGAGKAEVKKMEQNCFNQFCLRRMYAFV
ncbi:hypothetical protein GUJ93_ZPchr0009g671 [Zizania palustris]|uniref:Uncharacterized protein n=1 Tax=Zizania palustris TaxID=103762 RepID=A0A8J5RZW2_ZIZPA|nr:hypothetical protein GUJ93_ZPchr0009g671 [Zizania palustris]